MVFERREDRLQVFARELGAEADLVEMVAAVEHADDAGAHKVSENYPRKWASRTHRSNLSTTALSLSRHISLSHLLSSIDGRPGSTMTIGVKAVSSSRSECDEYVAVDKPLSRWPCWLLGVLVRRIDIVALRALVERTPSRAESGSAVPLMIVMPLASSKSGRIDDCRDDFPPPPPPIPALLVCPSLLFVPKLRSLAALALVLNTPTSSGRLDDTDMPSVPLTGLLPEPQCIDVARLTSSEATMRT